MAEPLDARMTGVKSYTEAAQTTYADVADVEPVTAGRRDFRPKRITVHYDWRTQLGDEGWTIGNIHISGPWLGDDAPEGSGFVILSMANAPDWARAFAEGNMPTATLVGAKPW